MSSRMLEPLAEQRVDWRPPPQPVAPRVPRYPSPLPVPTPNPRSRVPVTRAYPVWRLDGFASLRGIL